jgi:hypothetical protein
MTNWKHLGLAAVEEAGGEEDDGYHEGEAGVKPVVEADADEGVYQPGGEAQEPDPRCLSHHSHDHAPMRVTAGKQALPSGLVLH